MSVFIYLRCDRRFLQFLQNTIDYGAGIMYTKEQRFCPLIDEIDFKITTDGEF